LHRFGGVDFDVRGLIQISFQSSTGEQYPNKILDIPIKQSCQRLHFLHSAINCFGKPFGTEIGYYVVHQAGGGETRIPLAVGRELADWFTQAEERDTKFEVAWLGDNETARALGRKARLFKTTWQNPHPDQSIDSLDFVAMQGAAAPFLVAITAE